MRSFKQDVDGAENFHLEDNILVKMSDQSFLMAVCCAAELLLIVDDVSQSVSRCARRRETSSVDVLSAFLRTSSRFGSNPPLGSALFLTRCASLADSPALGRSGARSPTWCQPKCHCGNPEITLLSSLDSGFEAVLIA